MKLTEKKEGEGVIANAAMLGMTILVIYIAMVLLFNYYKSGLRQHAGFPEGIFPG